MTLDSALVAELQAIVGAQHVRTERGDVEPYARDATPVFRAVPDAVVWPEDTEQVAAVLRLATERRVPVVPRGAGSNLCAATVPLARVEAGVPTAVLADAAAAQGLLYAPDPGSRTVSTVGGNVATCAGGLRGLKYGTLATTCWAPRPCCRPAR
jgi:glycolate oxidase